MSVYLTRSCSRLVQAEETCALDIAEAALQVGGAWLGWWMVSAAAVSQIGQFEVIAAVRRLLTHVASAFNSPSF